MTSPLEKRSRVEISDASASDAFEIARVQEEAWFAAYPNEAYKITEEDIALEFSDRPDRIRKWEEKLKKETGKYTWIAKENGKVIGFCSAEKGPERNEVKALYVSPEYQGQEVGTQLLEKAFDWIGRDKDISLAVATYNTQAIEFYRKHGFREEISEAPSEAVRLPNGKLIPTIRITKRFEKK